MLKDEVGNFIPRSRGGYFDQRDDAVRNAIHLLVVDPTLGSRFSLVQAASQPGFVVDASASAEEARIQIARTRYSAVLVDNAINEAGGIDLLAELRRTHPDIVRVLVTAEKGLDFNRQAIERAGLALLLTKPFSADALRRNLRELLSDEFTFAGWTQVTSSVDVKAAANKPAVDEFAARRQQEIVLRGLLAGLNSCETECEVYELVHSELAGALPIARWIWLDEETGRVTRVAGDWPIEDELTLEKLSREELTLLRQAQRSTRVTRLDQAELVGSKWSTTTLAFLSLTIRSGRLRAKTCVVGLDRPAASDGASLLRELQGGLEMAFQRIREAERRAVFARNLARRVSEELRTPVGALTHAIDRLRGEAERAGISTKWVDEISSESERVVRAVEHLEGEMFAEPRPLLTTTNTTS